MSGIKSNASENLEEKRIPPKEKIEVQSRKDEERGKEEEGRENEGEKIRARKS